MLYIRSLGTGAASSPVPIADATAAALERALLTTDAVECERILAAAIDADAAFGEWARRESGSDQAARWWSDRLATKLDLRLASDDLRASAESIERRLPALVHKLGDCEERLAAFDQRLEHEKLESLKELAYGAGHEVNNPLANIAARAQSLLADEANPERQRKLTAIHRQAMRAHEMIADLMLFARPPKIVAAPFDLAELVQQVVSELTELAEERSIAITCDADASDLTIEADATQIGVAIAAVIKNAIEAVRSNGHIAVTSQWSDIGGERHAEVIVCDDGPGIPPHVRLHIFDPFFSGREAGRGLGFGLSKCWRIVTDHGGQVIVSSNPTNGAEFTISLPERRPLAV